MKLLTVSLLFVSAPLLLSGCGGGGSSSSPYDGTWQAVYPSATMASTFTETKDVTCNTSATILTIENASGTTTLTTSCLTEFYTAAIPAIYDAAGNETAAAVARAPISDGTQSLSYHIGVSIKPKATGSGNHDVLQAVVNGTSFTGECISTSTCSAVSLNGLALNLTR